MFYLALSLHLSLTNICNPFQCLAQVFCWKNANEVILVEDTPNSEQIPKTVKEMRELIAELKDTKP